MASDDGIVIRIPDTDAEPPSGERDRLRARRDRATWSPSEVGGSALFASRFRECAARALLLPRRDPGRRSPLWQQRQRARRSCSRSPPSTRRSRSCSRPSASASRTSTTCPRWSALMRRRRAARGQRPRRRRPSTPSPYARSLLFGYVAQFVYEGDSPIAERRAAALVPRPGPARRAARPRRAARAARPRGAGRGRGRAAAHSPPTAGPATPRASPTCCGCSGRSPPTRSPARSVRRRRRRRLARARWPTTRRAVEVRMAGEERWAAIEDVGRLRDGLGVPVPPGIPDAFTEPVDDPLGRPGRPLRPHPRPVHRRRRRRPARARRGRRPPHPAAARRRRAGCSRASSGPPAPGPSGATPRCCARCAAARWPGCARRSSRSSPQALARFLPAWQHVADGSGRRAACAASTACSPRSTSSPAAPVPASALEPLVLAARVRDYEPALPRRADRLRRGDLGRPRRRCPATTAGSRCTSPTRRR